MIIRFTEELKFTKKNDPVRNRLGSNEQFVGAVNYETSVKDRNGNGIHFEVGQYLWLGVWTQEKAAPYDKGESCLYSRQATEADVKVDMTFPTLSAGAQGPQFIPPFSISRQGSIPHGSSIQLFGSQPTNDNGTPQKNITGAPEIYPGASHGVVWDQDSLAFDATMGYTAEQLNAVETPPSRTKPDFANFTTPENYPRHIDPQSGEAYMGRIFNGAPLVIFGYRLSVG